ncbi:MAG: polyhydroxyalkanoate synthesis regulator [Candidatus Omnitrophica bacterium]|nr:polyhydroxyalkanoate synthesis regulator [Candidatus Omnitrophota bacterium]
MDTLKEALHLGLGLLVLTKENVEKIAKELVKKGKLETKEGEELIKELIKKGKVQEKEIEAQTSKAVAKALVKLNIANKDDIRRLENEIKQLKAQMKNGA